MAAAAAAAAVVAGPHWLSLQRSPDPLAGFQDLLRGKGGEGRREMEGEGNVTPFLFFYNLTTELN